MIEVKINETSAQGIDPLFYCIKLLGQNIEGLQFLRHIREYMTWKIYHTIKAIPILTTEKCLSSDTSPTFSVKETKRIRSSCIGIQSVPKHQPDIMKDYFRQSSSINQCRHYSGSQLQLQKEVTNQHCRDLGLPIWEVKSHGLGNYPIGLFLCSQGS